MGPRGFIVPFKGRTGGLGQRGDRRRRDRRLAVALALSLVVSLTPAAATAAGTGSISGTVTGPTSAPLAGIDVAACSFTPSGGSCGAASTAADGSYTINSLDPGEYSVSFTDPSGTYPRGVYDNTAPGDFAAGIGTLVTVGSGSVLGINVQIPVGAHVSGRVTGPDGRPLAGAEVEALMTNAGRFADVLTAADGTYRFVVLPGTYSIFVNAHSTAYPAGFYTSAGFTIFDTSATALAVSSEISGIDVQLPAGHWLKGRLLDRDGQPVSEIGTMICAPGTSNCRWASVAADGTFAELVPSGAYQFFVQSYSGPWVSGYYAANGSGLVDPALAATLTVGAGDLVGISPRVDRLLVPAFILGSTVGATVPFRVSWGTQLAGEGTPWYALERSIDGAAFASVTLPRPTATNLTVALAPGRRYQFRERGGATRPDGATVGLWQTGPTATPVISQESSAAISYAGAWAISTAASASGGRTRYATRAGASATLRFRGRAVALVAPKGPGQGSARIYIDGVYQQTINLRASAIRPRQVVAARSWATSGSHTIKVVVVGTSGHPRVDVDAFVALR